MIQVTLTFKSIAAAAAALRQIPEDDVVGTPAAPSFTTIGLEVRPEGVSYTHTPGLADEGAAAATAVAASRSNKPAPEVAATAPAPKPKATPAPTPAAPAPTPPTAAAEPAAAPAPRAEPSAPADEGPLDYAVLQKAVFQLAGKSRDAAAAVNAAFGVKTMKELPEARRREALAAVNAKIAELGA